MRDKVFKYVYHVTYHTTIINGDCFLYRKLPINTPEQVRSSADFISNEYCNGASVIIDNFILLNKKGIY